MTTTRTTYVRTNERTMIYPKLLTATRVNNTYSSSHGQTSVDPLQLAFTNLEPEEAAVAPASVPSEAGPVGVTEEAVAAAGSMGPTEAPEASAASTPQLLPRVGDTFGDSCTWSTNAGGDDSGDGGAAERASGASLDRGCRSAWPPWSKSLSLSLSLGGFEW